MLFVGVGAGAGTAFVLGQLRSTFADRGKLERAFELPVIGTISLDLTDAARALQQAAHEAASPPAPAVWAGCSSCCWSLEFVQRGMVA